LLECAAEEIDVEQGENLHRALSPTFADDLQFREPAFKREQAAPEASITAAPSPPIAYAEMNPDYTQRPDPSELLPCLNG
jgi:hypothetical protein